MLTITMLVFDEIDCSSIMSEKQTKLFNVRAKQGKKGALNVQSKQLIRKKKEKSKGCDE